MYLVLSMFGAVIGGAMSVMMRFELMEPGIQFFSDFQFYNVLVVFVRSRRDEGPQELTEDHDLTG